MISISCVLIITNQGDHQSSPRTPLTPPQKTPVPGAGPVVETRGETARLHGIKWARRLDGAAEKISAGAVFRDGNKLLNLLGVIEK